MFQQYLELERLRKLLNKWERDLPVLGETLASQKSRFAGNLAPARSNFVELRKQQTSLEMQSTELRDTIPARLDMNQPENLASYPQAIMLARVRALENALQEPARDWAGRQYRERLRRVRGLLLWDIAHNAAEQREQQQREASRLVEQSRVAGVRIQALEKLVQEATARLRGDLDQRLTAQYRDISRLRGEIDELISDVRQILKNDALRVLADSRKSLGDRLGEAHLAIARVQDESVSTQSGVNIPGGEGAENNKGSGQ
jgi:DNA repair exonuclease SbcCD ATPase subunit